MKLLRVSQCLQSRETSGDRVDAERRQAMKWEESVKQWAHKKEGHVARVGKSGDVGAVFVSKDPCCSSQ